MKICTIIAEFNPLHTGHKRLIDFAKSFADTVVVVLSGNYTQRGLPAVSSKHNRAKHAILAGAHLVVELPTIFATASAQNFAAAGVQIANKIGSHYLLFGSESGNIQQLTQCAKDMLECQQNNDTIKALLNQGLSYPQAVAAAFDKYQQLLAAPNNLLAVEYLKAIYTSNCTIVPVTLQRTSNYNDSDGQSSKSIRSALQMGLSHNECFDYVLHECSTAAEDNFKQYVARAISTMDCDYLSTIEGVTEGLENRIYKYATCGSYDQLVANLKTKRYTQLKLQRILTNACLGVTKQMVQQAKGLPIPVQILAVNKDREDLLSHLATTREELNPTVTNLTMLADRLYQACSNKPCPQNFILKV